MGRTPVDPPDSAGKVNAESRGRCFVGQDSNLVMDTFEERQDWNLVPRSRGNTVGLAVARPTLQNSRGSITRLLFASVETITNRGSLIGLSMLLMSVGASDVGGRKSRCDCVPDDRRSRHPGRREDVTRRSPMGDRPPSSRAAVRAPPREQTTKIASWAGSTSAVISPLACPFLAMSVSRSSQD